MADRIFASPLSGATLVISPRRARYHGITVRETVGAVAVVRVWDSPSAASGTLLDTVSLAANESAREFYQAGIEAQTGIFYEKVSGTVEGSIRVG